MQRNRYEVSTEQEPDAFKMCASFMRSNVLERPKIIYRCREKDVFKADFSERVGGRDKKTRPFWIKSCSVPLGTRA